MIRLTTIRRSAFLESRIGAVRWASNDAHSGGKRFMQTIPINPSKKTFGASLRYQMDDENASQNNGRPNRWAKHSLTFPLTPGKNDGEKDKVVSIEAIQPKRRSRADRYKKRAAGVDSDSKNGTSASKLTTSAAPEIGYNTESDNKSQTTMATLTSTEADLELEPSISEKSSKNISESTNLESTTTLHAQAATETAEKPKKKRRALRPRKALISLSPNAVTHLKALLDQPEPQLIRIGVRNRGCSGLTYHLEYVKEAGKFDELVEQDGVKVLIDSKALFSIVGSQMDWLDDKLSSRFIFKNPNSKGTCGCGESFMV